MEQLQFVPRKLKHSAKPKGNLRTQDGPSQIPESDDHRTRSRPVFSGSESIAKLSAEEIGRFSAKEKGKQRGELDGSCYAKLMSLALSDYSIWNNDSIQEYLGGSEDGFLPISFLLDNSSIFAGFDTHPPESIIAQAIKDSTMFEMRIALVQPDDNSWRTETRRIREESSAGGYEVRRRDWSSLKERIRKYTSFQWQERSIYVENLPLNARTIPSIHDFITNVAAPSASSERQLLQYISFPRHHNDPEDFVATKCKGFAFVIFTQAADARAFTERWPWEVSRAIEPKDEAPSTSDAAVTEARACGFRSMSKRRWEALKEEYLAVQARLLAQVVKSSRAKAAPRDSLKPVRNDGKLLVKDDDEIAMAGQVAPNQVSTTDIAQYSYPPNCLLFVKNVHPGTNKTTLRTLFAKAFEGSADAIDYVDYNKGLDSCYLRLRSPDSAQTLVQFFTMNALSQADGLDNVGAPSTTGSSKGIEVEIIQGTKEQVYWEKVPEKVRRQALAKAYPEQLVNEGSNESAVHGGQRKSKRRRVG